MFPNQGLYLEQKQKLLLTPELKQALQILQMPILELNEYLENALEENPLLEIEDVKEDSEETNPTDSEKIMELIAADWDYHEPGFVEDEKLSQLDLSNKNNYSLPSLAEYLYEQLFAAISSLEELDIGEFIINSLDDNGYFKEDWDKIATRFQVELEKVEKVVSLIKTFEPKGVGAKDLQECLLLQLDPRDLLTPLATEVIKNYLNQVGQGKLKEIAKETKASLVDVQEAIDLIKSLNPRPSNGFKKSDNFSYLLPDIAIKKIGDSYQVIVNEKGIPNLIISPFYRQILQSYLGGKEKEFIEEKFKKAVFLLKNIEQRRLTIIKVAEAIVDEQISFLEKGPDYLKPLTQKEIALRVGLHESTISRVVNRKCCQTDWGLFPLSYFFPSKCSSNQLAGDDITAEQVKKTIKGLIEKEDKSSPLSDQKIQQILKEQDIILARRTVAKYREEMGISSSSKRKRY